ncbi:MAG: hypothetical protein AAF587_17585 [Bacteroidota bacterium]
MKFSLPNISSLTHLLIGFSMIFSCIPLIGSEYLVVNQAKVSLFVEQMGGEVLLEWKVSEDIAIDSIIVERSSDGKSFREIFRKKSKIGVPPIKKMYDRRPPIEEGLFLFYRMLLFKNDGSTEYTDIGSVSISQPQRWEVSFQSDSDNRYLQIDFGSPQKERLEIRVTDGAGRRYYVRKEELVRGPNSFMVDITNWPQQFYFLQFKTSSHFERHNFVKK